MNRPTLAWAAFVLLIAVAFGAFGAHGLKAKVTPEALGQWQTGVQYQFYHGLGLLFLALAAEHLPSRTIIDRQRPFPGWNSLLLWLALFLGHTGYPKYGRDDVHFRANNPIGRPAFYGRVGCAHRCRLAQAAHMTTVTGPSSHIPLLLPSNFQPQGHERIRP